MLVRLTVCVCVCAYVTLASSHLLHGLDCCTYPTVEVTSGEDRTYRAHLAMREKFDVWEDAELRDVLLFVSRR